MGTGAVSDDKWVADGRKWLAPLIDEPVLAITMLWKWDLEREVDAAALMVIASSLIFGPDYKANPRIAPASRGLPVHTMAALTATRLVMFETKAKAKVVGGVRFKPVRQVADWPRDQVRAVLGAPTTARVQGWKIARRPLTMAVHGQPERHEMTIGTSPNDDPFLAELRPIVPAP